MSGRPQEAAAASRQEQQEQEDAWVDRGRVMNRGREESVMEETEQLRVAPAGRINSGLS